MVDLARRCKLRVGAPKDERIVRAAACEPADSLAYPQELVGRGQLKLSFYSGDSGVALAQKSAVRNKSGLHMRILSE